MKFRSAYREPRFISAPGPWAGHIPFAYWLIEQHRPRILVELGAFKGNSYFNFCHAIEDYDVEARSYAVDTWLGDPHSGYYGESVYESVRRYNAEHFGRFSSLIRATFDEAMGTFSDGSIDLLHIDGHHSYESASHDFETWRPKLSQRAVVALHDTAVRDGDFGVWRLFEELAARYPAFSFDHSHGLGVVLVGNDVSPELSSLAQHDGGQELKEARLVFQRLGRACELAAELLQPPTTVEPELEPEPESEPELEEVSSSDPVQEVQIDPVADRERELLARIAAASDLLAEAADIWPDETGDGAAKADVELVASNNELLSRVQHLESVVCQQEKRIRSYRRSISWKATAPFREVARAGKKALKAVSGKSPTVSDGGGTSRAGLVGPRQVDLSKTETVHIVCTTHTNFIGYLLAQSLGQFGLKATVANVMPEAFGEDLYIVVCPQMYDRLPPAERRICFQMEQSTSPRWFTPKYLELLAESLAVLDYSLDNLEYLASCGVKYPKTFYLPVSPMGELPARLGLAQSATVKTTDVLFYGDDKNPRRQRILEEVAKKYELKIISNLFGSELYDEIRRARLVLNIHYYENALLETTRICECLSLGVPVVSEKAVDQKARTSFERVVAFAEQDDVAGLMDAIGGVLGGPEPNIASFVREEERQFRFHLGRALLGLGIIGYPAFDAVCSGLSISSPRVVLSLPETIARRRSWEMLKDETALCFNGVRASPSWIGAGCSFKFLARRLLRSDATQVMIYEDDAEFGVMPPGDIFALAERVNEVDSEWDIFAALVSDLHGDAKVLDSFSFEGRQFIKTDRVVGMVCNIYKRRALERIAAWDPTHQDVATNTIDRYLEAHDDLRILTTLPFLVGHDEGMHSSLWGVKNDTMRQMIARSQRRLARKSWGHRVRSFLARD